jgi:outer membrane lipoprotein-sorting protein
VQKGSVVRMFRKVFWLVILVLLFTGPSPCQAEQQLSQILDGIKKRYGQMAGLSVPYQREILTKSMALLGDQMKTDVATGRIFFKPPHFLRVQQETPTTEDLITDGNVLWWYIPQKHQAHRIPSSKLGKELGLLEDVFQGLRGVEESFVVTLVGEDEKGLTLELTPNPPWPDTHHIDLLVNPKGFLIQKVEVYDLMGGVTRFTLGEVTEQKKFKQGFFSFVPPPGVRIIEE